MTTLVPDLVPGAVVWADLDPVVGREQGGRRPHLVVSSQDHLDTVTMLVTVVPVTSTDRGWPNHVRLVGDTGLSARSYAMTEQVRTIARERVRALSGAVTAECLRHVRRWVFDFTHD